MIIIGPTALKNLEFLGSNSLRDGPAGLEREIFSWIATKWLYNQEAKQKKILLQYEDQDYNVVEVSLMTRDSQGTV